MVPFLWVIASAFKNNDEIFGSPFLLPQTWHWDNFATVWTTGHFWVYFRNSLFVAVMSTIIGVAVACPAGYAFSKLRLRQHPALFYIYLFGLTLPIQTTMIPLFYQLKSYGLVDNLWGLIVVLVGTGTPFGVYLMRNFFRDLADSLIDAARIDGAGEWDVFWRIALPLSRPAILALAVFSFLTAWNEFLLALLLLVSDENRTIPLGLLVFQEANTSDYGALFAAIVLAMIPSMLVYMLLQRSFTHGLTAGASKE